MVSGSWFVHRSPRWAVQRAFYGAADMSPRPATNIKLIPARGDEAAPPGRMLAR